MRIIPEDDMEPSAPQTEGARERRYKVDVDQRKYGKADTDPDNEGDIADEGPGHRDVRPDQTK